MSKKSVTETHLQEKEIDVTLSDGDSIYVKSKILIEHVVSIEKSEIDRIDKSSANKAAAQKTQEAGRHDCLRIKDNLARFFKSLNSSILTKIIYTGELSGGLKTI